MVAVLSGLSVIFGAVNLYGIVSYLNGKPFLRLMSTDRGAFLTVWILGIIMCSFGIQISLKAGTFKGFGIISGLIIGLPMLIMLIFVLANRPVPVLGSYRNAVIAMAGLMGVKLVLALGQAVKTALAG